MSGIAADKYLSLSPLVSGRGMELINGRTANFISVSRGPLIDQGHDEFVIKHLLGCFARQHLELPTPVRILCTNVGCNTIWITHLQGIKAQGMSRLDRNIDNEPVGVIPETLPIRTQ